MMRAVVLVGLAACFEQPQIAEGLFCSTQGTCPPGQSCGADGRCRSTPGSLADAFQIDAGLPDGSAVCSLFPQGGCPFGSKCTNQQNPPMIVCLPDGTQGLKATCGGAGSADNCAAGLICIFGLCHQLCATAPDSCGADTCVPFSGFDICLTRCDALAQNCPSIPAGPQACIQFSAAGGVCAPSSNKFPAGTPCSFFNDCVGGTGCVCNDAQCMTGRACRQYCDFASFPNQQATCQPGETCQTFLGNVGACK